MKSRNKKRFLSILLISALVIASSVFGTLGDSTQSVQAATRDEAVAWANAQIGKGLDYDGTDGKQCVDLIKYYYAYFGVAGYARGNANKYITNALPPGWSRVYGDYQPGDIAVWKVSNRTPIGHVGIITSADSVGFNAVNQNYNLQEYCTQNWFYVSVLACAIRPVYTGSAPAQPVGSDITFADFNQNGVWDTNAEMYIKVMNPNRHTVSEVGCYLYNANGEQIKKYSESCNLSTSYVNYNCNLNNDMKITLSPGTTYKFVLYAIVNGQEYKDSMRSFTTTESAPVEVKPGTPSPTPKISGHPSGTTASPAAGQKQVTKTATPSVVKHPSKNRYIYDTDSSTKAPSKPAKVKLKKVQALRRGQVRVTWAKVSGAYKYQLQYSKKKSFAGKKTVNVYGKSKRLYLNTKKTYYIRVRAVKSGNSATGYDDVKGNWSAVRKVKTKR